LTYALSLQGNLTDTLTAATIGELPVDDDRRHSLNTNSFGSVGDCCVLHVEHRHIAGSASDSIDEIYCFVACGTPSAKNFDFSFVTHKGFSF
jgi:hypothetical protein